MLTRRQNLLAVVAGAALTPVLGWSGTARAADNDLTHMERSFGSPGAKTTCIEFFSLTCTHCAAFAAGTMPDVKKNLIETGKLRWVFHDYPLDQLALLASQIARYLPVDRYEPFINALLATQDRWAFARDANHTEEIWKTAGLAGMSRATFDKAIADDDLKKWILSQQRGRARTNGED